MPCVEYATLQAWNVPSLLILMLCFAGYLYLRVLSEHQYLQGYPCSSINLQSLIYQHHAQENRIALKPCYRGLILIIMSDLHREVCVFFFFSSISFSLFSGYLHHPHLCFCHGDRRLRQSPIMMPGAWSLLEFFSQQLGGCCSTSFSQHWTRSTRWGGVQPRAWLELQV